MRRKASCSCEVCELVCPRSARSLCFLWRGLPRASGSLLCVSTQRLKYPADVLPDTFPLFLLLQTTLNNISRWLFSSEQGFIHFYGMWPMPFLFDPWKKGQGQPQKPCRSSILIHSLLPGSCTSTLVSFPHSPLLQEPISNPVFLKDTPNYLSILYPVFFILAEIDCAEVTQGKTLRRNSQRCAWMVAS